MTDLYDRLTESPQTSIIKSNLSFDERAELRQLRVTRRSDVSPTYDGSFTTIYYLEGDDRAAARAFVDENQAQLEAIDFSNPDPIQSSLSRDLYDLVLHELGERELRKYRTVVYERRRDGTEWVIDREHFEQHPENRYAPDTTAARIGPSTTTEEIYDEFDDEITRIDLIEHDAVEGSERCLLEYYRVAGPFDCAPTTIGGQMALEKLA